MNINHRGIQPDTTLRTLASYLPEWQEDAREERHAGGLEFPWPTLNQRLESPIRRGELIIAGARPGVGKSFVVQEFARHNLQRRPEIHGLILSLEMPGHRVAGRAAAIALGMREIDARHIISEPDAADASLIARDHPWMQRLYIHAHRTKIDELEHIIRDYGCPEIVIVDYLGLLQSNSPGSREYERVSAAILECQQVGLATGSILAAAAQLKRRDESEGQEFVAPRSEDLKSSGDIEAAADRIIGLWRDKGEPRFLYAKAIKNRHDALNHEPVALFQSSSGEIVERTI